MCSWHLEPTDWLLMVHGDWDAPAGQYSSWETEVFFWFVLFIFQTLWGEAGISKCVHIQEEKTTFQITTATPVTQQIWNPRDSCLLFNPTTLVLKTKACAEEPQVALSGDFLYDPILLLVCWLAFLFIKKKSPFIVFILWIVLTICCWDLGFVLSVFLFGCLWVCSRNSQFFWYGLICQFYTQTLCLCSLLPCPQCRSVNPSSLSVLSPKEWKVSLKKMRLARLIRWVGRWALISWNHVFSYQSRPQTL